MRESRYAIVLCTTSFLGSRNWLDVDLALLAHGVAASVVAAPS
jgi:hypothetical protein